MWGAEGERTGGRRPVEGVGCGRLRGRGRVAGDLLDPQEGSNAKKLEIKPPDPPPRLAQVYFSPPPPPFMFCA